MQAEIAGIRVRLLKTSVRPHQPRPDHEVIWPPVQRRLQQAIDRLRNHRSSHDKKHHPTVGNPYQKALTDQRHTRNLNPLDKFLAGEDQVWCNHAGKDKEAQEQPNRDYKWSQ